LPDIVNFIQQAGSRLALFMLTLVLFFPGTGQAWAQEAKFGRFTTNFGPLILYQNKDKNVAGFYYYKGLPAHLFLSRKKNGRYKGIWVQAKSERKCSKTKNGSPYWGTVDAAFKAGNFLALWNYCDAKLVNQKNRQWKGKSQ